MEGVGSLSGLEDPGSQLLGGFDGNRILCHGDSAGSNDLEKTDALFQDTCYSIGYVLGVHTPELAVFTIGPVPCAGTVHLIFAPGTWPKGYLELFDVQGRRLLEYLLDGRSTELELDMDAQAAGLYVLRFSDRNGSQPQVQLINE
jgi:hypothetical protein